MPASAGDLADRLVRETDIPWRNLPSHIFRRLEALVAGKEVAYLDAYVEPTSTTTISGMVVAITGERIVLLTLTDAGRPDAGVRSTATVRAEAWSRKRLRSVALEPDAEAWSNVDDRWQEDWGDYWPPQAPVTLHYDGRSEPLVLPLWGQAPKEQQQRFRALLPGLLDDLT